MSLDLYRKIAEDGMREYNLARSKLKEEKEELLKVTRREKALKEAQDIIQNLAKSVQQKAHLQICSVVTECFKTIFGEQYAFHIHFEKRAHKTWAKMVFLEGDVELNPKTASAGGMVDVAAFALRVISIILSKPKLRKLIVADEPMKFVNGEEYQERMGDMVQYLSDKLGIQMIIVTDDDWLKSDNDVKI